MQKKSRELPKVIQMTMRCSRSPLWRNTAGLCEVQSRIYVVNRWKYYPDYFPDPLALSELVKARALMIASFKNTPHQKHGMSQSVTNAGESQWAFDSPAVNLSFEAATFEFKTSASSVSAGFAYTVAGFAARDGDEDLRIKAWIWVCSSQSEDSGLQRTNKIVSFRNYVAVFVFFIVLLSVTACRRKHCFLWPMANKVNITWQVKVKRFQMLFILRFKLKSCLTLCRPIIGNDSRNHTNKTSKQFNDAIENNWYDN